MTRLIEENLEAATGKSAQPVLHCSFFGTNKLIEN